MTVLFRPHQTGRAVFPHPAFPSSFVEAEAFRYRVIGSCRRLFALIALAGRHHILPCSSLLRNKWRPFAPPRVFRTKGPARDHHYYERLRLLSRPARPSPVTGLCRWFESGFTRHDRSPLNPSVTSDMVAHADPAGPLSKPTTVGPGSDSAAFADT